METWPFFPYPESSVWGVWARCLGVVVMLPFGDSLTVVPRLLLTIGLAAGILGSESAGLAVGTPAGGVTAWLIPLIEFVVGVVLATPVRVAVESAELLGELLDTTRGQTIGSVQDPLSGQSGSDLATVCRIGVVVAVFHFGALEHLAATVVQSYTIISAPRLLGGEARPLLSAWGVGALALVWSALKLALVWAVPFILVDVTTAVAHRLCGALSFSISGTVLKTAITFGILSLWLSDLRAAPSDWLEQVLLKNAL